MYSEDFGGWMHMNSHVDFEHGRQGHVQAGWGFPPSYPFTMTIRVILERGAVEWNFKAGRLLETRDSEAPLVVYRDDSSAEKVQVDQSDPFLLQWRYFIDCIETGQTPRFVFIGAPDRRLIRI